MKNRSLSWMCALLVGSAICAAFMPMTAQTPAAFRAPRTPLGQPNFQGIWQAMSSAHYDLEPHAASFGIPAGLGVVSDPADGKIPYNAAGLAKRAENLRNRATADPYEIGRAHV